MRRIVVGSVGGVLLLAGLVTLRALGGPSSPIIDAELPRAQSALLHGLVAGQQAMVPPGLSPTVAKDAALSAHSDLATRNAMKASAAARLRGLFSGKALGDFTTATNNGIDALADPSFRVLGGGADSLRVADATRLDASTLKITGTVRMWSSMAQVQGTKLVPATPSNLVDFRAILRKQPSGAWLTTDYTWSFHPGSEP